MSSKKVQGKCRNGEKLCLVPWRRDTVCVLITSGLNFGSLQDGDKFEDQGRFAAYADLARHVAQMGTDGIICNIQLVPDLLVVEALAKKFRDLDFSRRQMPAFTKIVPLFSLQNHDSFPLMVKHLYLLPELYVQNITTLIPHIHTSKDLTRLVVLLISQKDYEHYIVGGFHSKFFYFRKYVSSDMGVAVGQL